jgi:hypothetical protein
MHPLQMMCGSGQGALLFLDVGQVILAMTRWLDSECIARMDGISVHLVQPTSPHASLWFWLNTIGTGWFG